LHKYHFVCAVTSGSGMTNDVTTYISAVRTAAVNCPQNVDCNNYLIPGQSQDSEAYSENITGVNGTSSANHSLFPVSPPLGMILMIPGVGSRLEQVLLGIYLTGSMLTANVFNVTVLFAILRDWRALAKRPENVIIFGDCINNLLLAYSVQPLMIWTYATEYPTQPVNWICQVSIAIIVHFS